MRVCSGCRPPPTPVRACSPRLSTWTSRLPRDAARLGPGAGPCRRAGDPLPPHPVRRGPSLPAVGVVAASLVLTAVLYSPVAIPQLPSAMPSSQVLLAVLTLAVVCTALGFLLFFALISEVGPVRATVITYFNPAVALLLGVVLLREPFTVGAVVGFSLILAGSVLATRRTSALAGSAPVPSSTAWGAVARYRRARQRRSQG